MTNERTHASFFSGVGGLDLGLERAGWRTVSFSEIDPYASAVLAERWPGVPNLGDIVALEDSGCEAGNHRFWITGPDGQHFGGSQCWDCDVVRADGGDTEPDGGRAGFRAAGGEWHRAVLWTGGFPCQDLSVAGKRRGMVEGTRSNLAYAFLALVERHRPPAILLENVPGLLSSHGGRDMAALLGAMVELGYGVAYRVLDARHFGVPQRRRRVFIVGLRSGPDDPSGRVAAERAAAVLAVGARCPRHPATGHEAGEGTPDRARPGVDIARAVTGTAGKRHDDDTDTLIANGLRASDGHHGYSSPRGDGGDNLVPTLTVGGRASGAGSSYDNTPWGIFSPSPDSGGVRAADGLAGRLDDRGELAGPILSTGQGGQRTTDLNTPLVYLKHSRYGENGDPRRPEGSSGETWGDGSVSHSLDSIGHAARTATAILGTDSGDDPLLPLGLDSHRYRCCGNGVVAPVAEWLGARLAAAL